MVYRDGFGVRIAPDWMEFSSNVTSGGSWYGLRNNNTIGHIDITMEHNAALIEKSDREGFVDTPAWRQFFLIATKLKDEINGIVEDLRRAHAVGVKRSGPSSVPTADRRSTPDIRPFSQAEGCCPTQPKDPDSTRSIDWMHLGLWMIDAYASRQTTRIWPKARRRYSQSTSNCHQRSRYRVNGSYPTERHRY
jgi:hypothetical protein